MKYEAGSEMIRKMTVLPEEKQKEWAGENSRTAVGQPQRLGGKSRKVVRMEGSDGQQGGAVPVPVRVMDGAGASPCSSGWHSSGRTYFAVHVQSCLPRGSEQVQCKAEAMLAGTE